MIAGRQIGEGFIARRADGSISSEATYVGCPIVLRLEPDERNGLRGYRVTLHEAAVTSDADRATA